MSIFRKNYKLSLLISLFFLLLVPSVVGGQAGTPPNPPASITLPEDAPPPATAIENQETQIAEFFAQINKTIESNGNSTESQVANHALISCLDSQSFAVKVCPTEPKEDYEKCKNKTIFTCVKTKVEQKDNTYREILNKIEMQDRAAKVSEFRGLNYFRTSNLTTIAGNALKTIMSVLGALSLGVFIYGGILWMTSRGNGEQVQKAMKILTWAVLGLVLIFSSYALVDFLFSALG